MLIIVKQNMEMQDKIVDLESHSRRNNLRIYGVPEGKEGRSVTEFVSELFKIHLNLPDEIELQIQQAHRALIPKPATTSSLISIIVNFLQFHVKELVFRKAWQQKIEIGLYFDNNYAADIMERHKAYGPIKAALKEKGIRFQMPYMKMRVHWDSRLQIYGSVDEAAQDLNKRGFQVTVTTRTSAVTAVEE